LRAVLRAVPLGSSAQLSAEHLSVERLAQLNVRPRDVRELGSSR
jgi:hypothetical protein